MQVWKFCSLIFLFHFLVLETLCEIFPLCFFIVCLFLLLFFFFLPCVQSWSGGYRKPAQWRPTWKKTPGNKSKTRWCRRSEVRFRRGRTAALRTRTIKETPKQKTLRTEENAFGDRTLKNRAGPPLSYIIFFFYFYRAQSCLKARGQATLLEQHTFVLFFL